MVIKTGICAFSEERIYPGHGSRFVRKDGQLVTFISSKSHSLYLQKKKPAHIGWTQAWRRLHKKVDDVHATKRRVRRVRKQQRAIVGQTLEELRSKRRAGRPAKKTTRAKTTAVKEVKTRVARK